MNAETIIARADSLRLATLRARKRLADDEIGACVKQGLFQVHRCHYPKGKSSAVVMPLSSWLTMDEAIAFLDAMESAS